MTTVYYYLAWSPRHGEATFTRCFSTPGDRAAFALRLETAASVRTWENTYPA